MIKLSCNSCGAKLELTDDISRFACAHCGSEWIVERGGGVVCLKGLEDGLKRVEGGICELVQEIKAGRSEEEIRREEELRVRAREEIEDEKRAAEQEEINRKIAEEERKIKEDSKTFMPYVNAFFILMALTIAIFGLLSIPMNCGNVFIVPFVLVILVNIFHPLVRQN
jgi:DNA-directed RNA polymerase subunit RPC12/RpoP